MRAVVALPLCVVTPLPASRLPKSISATISSEHTTLRVSFACAWRSAPCEAKKRVRPLRTHPSAVTISLRRTSYHDLSASVIGPHQIEENLFERYGVHGHGRRF